MGWPLKKDETNNAEVKPGETPLESKKDEKSAAELIAAALQPITSRFDQLEAKFADQEKKFIVKPAKVEEKQTEAPRMASVFDNEDLAINQRIMPIAVETLNTKAEVMYDRAAREYSEKIGVDAWAQIAPDVRKFIDEEQNPMLRANPEYIKRVIRLVMGEKAESGFRFDATGKRFFLEDASHSDAANKSVDMNAGLSTNPKTRERQLKAMASFKKASGMTPEEYKKAMGDLEVVTDV